MNKKTLILSMVVVLVVGMLVGRFIRPGVERLPLSAYIAHAADTTDVEKNELSKELESLKIELALLDSRILKMENVGQASAGGNTGGSSSGGESVQRTAYVDDKYSGVNTRSGPGQDNPLVQRIEKGVPLPIIGESGDWYKVKLPDGKEAWVANWVVKVE